MMLDVILVTLLFLSAVLAAICFGSEHEHYCRENIDAAVAAEVDRLAGRGRLDGVGGRLSSEKEEVARRRIGRRLRKRYRRYRMLRVGAIILWALAHSIVTVVAPPGALITAVIGIIFVIYASVAGLMGTAEIASAYSAWATPLFFGIAVTLSKLSPVRGSLRFVAVTYLLALIIWALFALILGGCNTQARARRHYRRRRRSTDDKEKDEDEDEGFFMNLVRRFSSRDDEFWEDDEPAHSGS